MSSEKSQTKAAFDASAFSAFELRGWQRNADGWLRHFESVSQQSIAALLDAVGITTEAANTGRRVLDVATGPGYGAGEAAKRGAEGCGIDFSSAQIELAEQKYKDANFQVADAEDLPFEDEIFDAVIINFGLLHFAAPERALREAYRVLRPGGRIAYTNWAPPPRVVGFHVVQQAIAEHGDLSVELPEGPPYYRFADPDESRRALATAGFKAVRVFEIPQTWRLTDPDHVLIAVADGTVRSGALFRAQAPAARCAIAVAVRDAVQAYEKDGVIELPMPAVLSVATKLV